MASDWSKWTLPILLCQSGTLPFLFDKHFVSAKILLDIAVFVRIYQCDNVKIVLLHLIKLKPVFDIRWDFATFVIRPLNYNKTSTSQSGGGPKIIKIDPVLDQVVGILGRGCTGISGVADCDAPETGAECALALPKVICLENEFQPSYEPYMATSDMPLTPTEVQLESEATKEAPRSQSPAAEPAQSFDVSILLKYCGAHSSNCLFNNTVIKMNFPYVCF